MMRTIRILTFVGLLATVHLTGAMDLIGGGEVVAASARVAATSCDIEPTYNSYPEYVGSCPWAAGCGEALQAAAEYCNTEVYPDNGYASFFWCEDPLEPPTNFSFNCEPWWVD